MPTAATKRFLTVQELADELQVAERTVRRMLAAGTIRYTRLGPRLVRIPVSELDRLANCADLCSASQDGSDDPTG